MHGNLEIRHHEGARIAHYDRVGDGFADSDLERVSGQIQAECRCGRPDKRDRCRRRRHDGRSLRLDVRNVASNHRVAHRRRDRQHEVDHTTVGWRESSERPGEHLTRDHRGDCRAPVLQVHRQRVRQDDVLGGAGTSRVPVFQAIGDLLSDERQGRARKLLRERQRGRKDRRLHGVRQRCIGAAAPSERDVAAIGDRRGRTRVDPRLKRDRPDRTRRDGAQIHRDNAVADGNQAACVAVRRIGNRDAVYADRSGHIRRADRNAVRELHRGRAVRSGSGVVERVREDISCSRRRTIHLFGDVEGDRGR